MTRFDDTLTALRSLDPADPNPDPHSPRARADLARILQTDPSTRQERTRAFATPRRRLRMVAFGVPVAAVVAAAVVALPSFTGGDRAVASWTAMPQSLTGQAASDAAKACRDRQADNSHYQQALRNAKPVIVERRGIWTMVVLADDKGFAAHCITDESVLISNPVLGDPGVFDGAGTGGIPPASGPTDLFLSSAGGSAGKLSYITGITKGDVVGVTFESTRHGTVTATVSNGHFALWLPGDELNPSKNREVELHVTYRSGAPRTVTFKL